MEIIKDASQFLEPLQVKDILKGHSPKNYENTYFLTRLISTFSLRFYVFRELSYTSDKFPPVTSLNG